MGILFTVLGLFFLFFSIYPYIEKTSSIEGTIIDEYRDPQSIRFSDVSAYYTPFTQGRFHVVFRQQDDTSIDLNYSTPEGLPLVALDRNQNYLIEYNSSTNRIYNMWAVSKIDGRNIPVGPNSYGSNSSNRFGLFLFGALGVILVTSGILLVREIRQQKKIVSSRST